MEASPHEVEFKSYRQTWRLATIPAFLLLAAWVYLWFVHDWPNEHVIYLLPFVSPTSDAAAFVSLGAMLLHKLALLSPVLAWLLARRRLRAASSPPRPSPHAHRGASKQSELYVSALFPRWALVMVLVSVFCESFEAWGGGFIKYVVSNLILLPCTYLPGSALEPCLRFAKRAITLAAVAHAILLYLWWRRCRVDTTRVGVIERENRQDGRVDLVLRTPRDARLAMVSRAGKSRDVLRVNVAGSTEEWRAVVPVDEILGSEASQEAP